MQLRKIIILFSSIIAFTPLSALSETASKNTLDFVEQQTTAEKKPSQKSAVTAKKKKKAKATKKAKAKSSKKVKKSAVPKKKSTVKAHSKSQPKKAKSKNIAKNETKKRYGIKGATLAPVKVQNKTYSYREKGKTHTSISKEASRQFSQTGTASYYGGKFHGRRTASGEIFNKNAYTAAHKTLALGSYALVTNLRNGRKVIVRINDRGPFSKNRIIDLSVAAAREIGMIHSGVAKVKIEAMHVDRQGYISGKGAESLYQIAKRTGLPLKVKGEGKNFAIKAE